MVLYKILYNWGAPLDDKPIEFIGTSLDDLRAFPVDVRQQAGYQLGLVQSGRMPDDFKPMPTVGQGCYEIGVSSRNGN